MDILRDEKVITVRGCVDFTNSHELSDALSRAIQDGDGVAIDLSETGMLDSSAVAHLLAAQKCAQAKGIEMTVLAASEDVKHILQMGGVASAFGLPPLTLEKRPVEDKSRLQKQDWYINESVILAEPELAVSLRDLAVDAAIEAGLPDTAIRDVRLAVTEALANALVHGSPDPGKSKIRLRCLACPCAFVTEVVDEGPGVPREAIEKMHEADADTGLGLRLMEQSMDEVDYLHSEQGSCVRMLKWIRGD